MKKKVAIFDFDGTLIASDTLKKRDAWFEIFPEEGKVSRATLLNVLVRVPETRFDILRELFRTLGEQESEVEHLVQEYAERYNAAVQRGLERLGLMPGVREALEELSKLCRLYINTATPEYGIRETVRRLEIQHFFTDVMGKPASKEENIQTIISRERVSPEEAIMVGNGMDDLGAAQATGVFFVGIRDQFNAWDGKTFPVVSDWFELRERLKQLNLLDK